MAYTFLQNQQMPELNEDYTPEALALEYERRKQQIVENYRAKATEHREYMSEMKSSVVEDEKQKISNTSEHLSALDFEPDDIQKERAEYQKHLFDVKKQISDLNTEIKLLNQYGEQFAQLKQIFDREEKFGEGAVIEFQEISQASNDITPEETYYAGLANGGNGSERLALHIELPDVPAFDLSVIPFDAPDSAEGNQGEEKETDDKPLKFQLSMSDEDAASLSDENWAKIIAFCESHGLPSYAMDLPYSGDGNLTHEKFNSLLSELHKKVEAEAAHNMEAEQKFDELQEQWENEHEFSAEQALGNGMGATRSRNGSSAQNNNGNNQNNNNNNDLSPLDRLMQSRAFRFGRRIFDSTAQVYRDAFSQQQESEGNNTGGQQVAAPKVNGEEIVEDLLFNSLGKRENLSFFKTGGSILGGGYTVYTVFDSENADNMKENGVKTKGKVKYTYSYKLYVGHTDDGELSIMYHVRENKKLDEGLAGALAGKFKDLKYTHINIPTNIPDCDKKTIRIALAEKGIVPVGMSLDKSKAQGMIKAAKEKLTAEDFATFKYRLALQMEENAMIKGKKLAQSEKDFIDSLKNAHDYSAFVDAYNNNIKSVMRKKLSEANDNYDDGAINKIAVYMTLNKLFEIYDTQTMANSSLVNSDKLTPEEKRLITAAGADRKTSQLSAGQMTKVYEILFEQCKKDAKKRVDKDLIDARDIGNTTSKGAKRPDDTIIKNVFNNIKNGFDDINDALATKGCEEIAPPKASGFMYYDQFYREHPEFTRRNTNNNNNTNNNGGNARNGNNGGNGGNGGTSPHTTPPQNQNTASR